MAFLDQKSLRDKLVLAKNLEKKQEKNHSHEMRPRSDYVRELPDSANNPKAQRAMSKRSGKRTILGKRQKSNKKRDSCFSEKE